MKMQKISPQAFLSSLGGDTTLVAYDARAVCTARAVNRR